MSDGIHPPPPQPVVILHLPPHVRSPCKLRDERGYDIVGITNLNNHLTRYVEGCEEARASITREHENQLKSIEHNQFVVQYIIDTMTHMGIKDTYMSPALLCNTEAGYMGDIRRNIVVDDGYDDLIKVIDTNIEYATHLIQRVIGSAITEQRTTAIKHLRDRKNSVLALLRLKYEQSADSNPSSIACAILCKDPFLRYVCTRLLNDCNFAPHTPADQMSISRIISTYLLSSFTYLTLSPPSTVAQTLPTRSFDEFLYRSDALAYPDPSAYTFDQWIQMCNVGCVADLVSLAEVYLCVSDPVVS